MKLFHLPAFDVFKKWESFRFKQGRRIFVIMDRTGEINSLLLNIEHLRTES